MADIRLLGLRISVYTRIARLALAEKALEYQFEEVDIFADSGPPADYLALNPFGTIPCLLHGDLVLYETAAITRYLDDICPGDSLQPAAPAARARMNQVIGMLDSYCYRPMIWAIYVQRTVVPAAGGTADETVISAALPGLRRVLEQLARWRGSNGFLAGESLSLADLHLYPMLAYFVDTPEGRSMMEDFPDLQRWLHSMEARRSVRATPFALGEDANEG